MNFPTCWNHGLNIWCWNCEVHSSPHVHFGALTSIAMPRRFWKVNWSFKNRCGVLPVHCRDYDGAMVCGFFWLKQKGFRGLRHIGGFLGLPSVTNHRSLFPHSIVAEWNDSTVISSVWMHRGEYIISICWQDRLQIWFLLSQPLPRVDGKRIDLC